MNGKNLKLTPDKDANYSEPEEIHEGTIFIWGFAGEATLVMKSETGDFIQLTGPEAGRFVTLDTIRTPTAKDILKFI